MTKFYQKTEYWAYVECVCVGALGGGVQWGQGDLSDSAEVGLEISKSTSTQSLTNPLTQSAPDCTPPPIINKAYTF